MNGVSKNVRFVRVIHLFVILSGMFSYAANMGNSDSRAPCKADGPVLSDASGKPIWLGTQALLRRSTHCEAPQMPALWRQARIQGYVFVDILVDERGRVACVRLVSGHPMLAGAAIDAAKNWTFEPKKEKGRAIAFYGHLSFYFSTVVNSGKEGACTTAHW